MSRQPARKLPSHYLKPGEMYLAMEPTVISTLLGSCVSVTMFHPGRHIGAICHGQHPVCRRLESAGQCQDECEDGFKNMACAIRLMFDRFRDLGIMATELEVKVFGGSDMFVVGNGNNKKPTVGKQNLDITRRLLAEAGVRVKAFDLGGERGRKIFFNSYTGEVLLKRLHKTSKDGPVTG